MTLKRGIRRHRTFHKGIALIVCMFFVAIFTALAVAMVGMADTNSQLANNQHHANLAMAAAQSGIECGRYLVANANTGAGFPSTGSNTVSSTDVSNTWSTFCTYVHNHPPAGKTVSATPTNFTDAHGSGTQLVVPSINFIQSATPTADPTFTLKFNHYTNPSDPNIYIVSTGYQDGASKKITIGMLITKSNTIMQYAISAKPRVWITCNSTIHGNIYSSWQYQNISPFNMTSDSKVLGTINTILTNINPSTGKAGSTLYAGTTAMPYTLETLASGSNNPVAGLPIYTVTSQSLYSATGGTITDSVSGYGINGSPGIPVYDSFGNLVYGSNGNPLYNINGNPLYDAITGLPVYSAKTNGNLVYGVEGNKVISPAVYQNGPNQAGPQISGDQIQGPSNGINYNVNYGDKAANMPGMNLSDYDTSTYKSQTTVIPTTTYDSTSTTSHGHTTTTLTTVTEYAPSAAGNYSQPSGSGSLKLTRYVCTGKTLTNAQVTANQNMLFENCTFNGILYVNGGTSSSTSNNIRFDDCTFNGPIVTTPATDTSSGWWQRNQLYFTGSSTFQNQTNVPATILAPNFSLDIGNDNPTMSDDNVLTGAIVGGIVDIRGTAKVYGTIISMFDTSGYSSGYVSNIGATIHDGGSETTIDPGDIGTIDITPNPNQLLPSGVTTPIILSPQPQTYTEG